MDLDAKRIAIACQGGGSHTAFTAGALRRLLRDDFPIAALSGTSGGAICALLAWYGLIRDDRALALRLLEDFWNDNAANSLWDWLVNSAVVGAARLRGRVALPEVSPYDLPNFGQTQFRALLERHVDFGNVRPFLTPASPRLYVGAVEVLSGEFTVFRDAQVTVEAVMASAAIPNLFRAVTVPEQPGRLFWDGLFSQNPPLRNLTEVKPDEIWIIRINPERVAREPRSVEAILDRRNELSGNLSLEQEKRFIRKINELLEEGTLTDQTYKIIEIREIALGLDLDYASKLDRNPAFLRDLMALGYQEADRFVNQLKAIEKASDPSYPGWDQRHPGCVRPG